MRVKFRCINTLTSRRAGSEGKRFRSRGSCTILIERFFSVINEQSFISILAGLTQVPNIVEVIGPLTCSFILHKSLYVLFPRCRFKAIFAQDIVSNYKFCSKAHLFSFPELRFRQPRMQKFLLIPLPFSDRFGP